MWRISQDNVQKSKVMILFRVVTLKKVYLCLFLSIQYHFKFTLIYSVISLVLFLGIQTLYGVRSSSATVEIFRQYAPRRCSNSMSSLGKTGFWKALKGHFQIFSINPASLYVFKYYTLSFSIS